MSKFFAGGASDSDYSSSEEEDLYLSEEIVEESESDTSSALEDDGEASGSDQDDAEEESGPQQFMRNKFLKGQGSDSDDSDDDDDRGAIKSAKDKLLDEIAGAVKNYESAAASDDWIGAASAFDRTFKSQERAMRQYSVVPASIVKLLVGVDEQISAARAKKLNPSNSKAVNVINQRAKKLAKEYETRIEQYKQDPATYDPEPPLVSDMLTPTQQESDEFTATNVFTMLADIVKARGKKKTDKAEQVEILEKLFKVSDTPYKQLSVLLIIVPIRFDMHPGGIMQAEVWQAIEGDIRQIYDLLEANPEYVVIESAREPEDFGKPPALNNGVRQIPGSVSALVERLDDEHVKALQLIDPHTTEYIERLRDQTKLYDLVLRAQCHTEHNLERLGKQVYGNEALCRLLVRRLDSIYYKPSEAIVGTELNAWAEVPSQLSSKLTPRLEGPPSDAKQYTTTLVDSICKALYNQSNTAFRSKAMLALIYHYALNDMYYQARDLMLMSHLQSTIHNAEPSVQIMFNRALVQVGLCAFRIGLIADALQALQEVCSSQKLKELLGQGISKSHATSGSGSPDRSQILPFHMHINIELIECVYLTSSLLIEVPASANINLNRVEKRKSLSKPFRRMLDFHDRQVFNGPSENTRDHIIQAAKALQVGDWKTSVELLCSIKVWQLLSNPDDIMTMLRHKLQCEGLCTYLLVFGTCYETLSLEYLTQQFELPLATVVSQIQKMIANDELQASFDVSDKYIEFSSAADHSKLETLGSTLADKASVLAERNERLVQENQDLKKPKKAKA